MSAPLLTVDDLRVAYATRTGPREAVRGVSFAVRRGETTALVGESGSGKSTLMNLIGCLDTPSKGSYLLNGKQASQMNDNELARIRNEEIGFVFQTFNLLARTTALQNVELPLVYAKIPRLERRQLAEEALTNVGLKDRMNHQPNELSGGQRQRVAIARSLVNDPHLILGDEPTGNLDSKTSVEIMQMLRDLNEAGKTIIMVTHENDIAAWARRVVRLRDGRVESDVRNDTRTVVEMG